MCSAWVYQPHPVPARGEVFALTSGRMPRRVWTRVYLPVGALPDVYQSRERWCIATTPGRSLGMLSDRIAFSEQPGRQHVSLP